MQIYTTAFHRSVQYKKYLRRSIFRTFSFSNGGNIFKGGDTKNVLMTLASKERDKFSGENGLYFVWWTLDCWNQLKDNQRDHSDFWLLWVKRWEIDEMWAIFACAPDTIWSTTSRPCPIESVSHSDGLGIRFFVLDGACWSIMFYCLGMWGSVVDNGRENLRHLLAYNFSTHAFNRVQEGPP